MISVKPNRTAEIPETSLARDIFLVARSCTGGRRGLLVLGGFAVAGGAMLNWSLLAATGIAPLLRALNNGEKRDA